MQELDLDVASDFLLVAATLLEIKAASLLPEEIDYTGDELDDLSPEDARELLVARLLAYKQFKNISGELGGADGVASRRMHPRQAGLESDFLKLMPDYLEGITLRGLAVICADLEHRREVFLLQAEHVASQPISLELHAESVSRTLAARGTVGFMELLGDDPTPELVVVTLLAILELYKRGMADLRQDELHGDIIVTAVDREGLEYQDDAFGQHDEEDRGVAVSVPIQLRGAVEALLFVSDEPVSAARIARVLDAKESEVSKALAEIAEDCANNERGFQLREVAGGWRFFTHPAYHESIEQYVLSWDTRRLSQAALEALAVMAYHQPVTRQGVNAVRGVNSEGVISSLVDKGLVREVGRDKNQGNAITYGTTRTFLEKFGLKDLSDLPPLEEFAPDPKTERAIRERLSALDGSSFGEESPDLDDEADFDTQDETAHSGDTVDGPDDSAELPDEPPSSPDEEKTEDGEEPADAGAE